MEIVAQYVTNPHETEDTMSAKIRVMVPQLMQERGIRPMDLIYGARIAPGTAYTLSDVEKSQKMTAISFDVLTRLCLFFKVTPNEILKFDEENQE